MNEKFDHSFDNLKFAAKVNLAFAYLLKNSEDGMFRYFYTQEKNTLLEQSKFVCTKDDSTKLTPWSRVVEKRQTQNGDSTS